MNKKHKEGFAIVGILIPLVIILAIGTGIFYYKNLNKKAIIQNQTIQVGAPVNTSTDKIESKTSGSNKSGVAIESKNKNKIDKIVKNLINSLNEQEINSYAKQLSAIGPDGIDALKNIVVTSNELVAGSVAMYLSQNKIISSDDAKSLLLRNLNIKNFVSNNKDLLQQARDTQRIKDIFYIGNEISFYISTNGYDFCNSSKIYSSNQGSAAINGSGWVPINFLKIANETGIKNLPLPPNANAETGLVSYDYKFACDATSKTYELSTRLESNKYIDEVGKKDGGSNPQAYEIGTNLNLIP